MKKRMVVLLLAFGFMFGMVSTAFAGQWNVEQDGTYYYKDDGTAANFEWLKIDGKWYFFWEGGDLYHGWLSWKGNWYYLKDNGEMAVNTRIGNYAVGSDGAMLRTAKWNKDALSGDYCRDVYAAFPYDSDSEGGTPCIYVENIHDAGDYYEGTATIYQYYPGSETDVSNVVTTVRIAHYARIDYTGGIWDAGTETTIPSRFLLTPASYATRAYSIYHYEWGNPDASFTDARMWNVLMNGDGVIISWQDSDAG